MRTIIEPHNNSAIMGSSSSSTVPPMLLYDVFLSFSGTDTRRTFTGHLLAALNRQGFSTFRDDTKLQRGEDIRSQLPTAITNSRVSIVVFSKNYAVSGWCLDELVKIMECRRDFNQIVLPIFYDVDPSDVSSQGGCYAKAFEDHENGLLKERVVLWREALTEAANLSGWHLQNLFDGDEAKLINLVVEEVTNRLDRLYSGITDHPVGIDSRVQELKTMSKLESDDVSIVAIWGVGGLGKTTIAKAIFNSIRNKFEASSFLADVNETCKTAHGVITLQKQLLSNILMNETHNLDNYHQGIEVIRRKLCLQRILLVLDDVDHIQQLKMFSVNRDLFSKGSKIIITTRNLSSLTSLQVDSVYSPAELNNVESLKLFSLHAFKSDHPKEAFWELSQKVVSYAEGLPLALEVFGSFFCGRSTAEWVDGLEKLKKHPHDDIQGKLRISFESLDKNDQELLLDIAFFFIGRDRYFTVRVLEGSDCFPEIGIGELVRRCLVRVDKYNRLRMHSLLRDMAREIVSKEPVKEPGEHSRLRGHDDVLQVLRDCTGTKAIEGLCLELPESNDEHINAVAFENMRNLRILHLNYLSHLKGTYVTTTRKLKWLSWHQFPLPCIPADLHMENIVAIDLQHSKLKQIWKGPKRLNKLRFLNLSHSQYMTETPDFSGLKSLEELLLHDCTSLVEVHNSIGCLDKLLILDLANCKSLRNIPSSISMLTSLLFLDLSGNSRHYGLVGFKEPLSMFQLLVSARPQKSVPTSLASIQQLSFIQVLRLADCNMSHVPSEFGSLTSLLEVNLEGNKFSTLPSSFSNLHNLQFLLLNRCAQLESLPNLPNNLTFLGASHCESLDTPSAVSQLGKARWILFDSCPKFDDDNFKRNILQLYQGHPEYDVFLPGSEVPNYFPFQGIGSGLSFIVPPDVGEKIRGWIACGVIRNPNNFHVRLAVINQTKGTTTYHPRSPDGLPESLAIDRGPEHIMWFHYVSSSSDGFNMEGGDEVHVFFLCFNSKNEYMDRYEVRCGIRLIYERDGEDQELSKESNDHVDIASEDHSSGKLFARAISLHGEDKELSKESNDHVDIALEDHSSRKIVCKSSIIACIIIAFIANWWVKII